MFECIKRILKKKSVPAKAAENSTPISEKPSTGGFLNRKTMDLIKEFEGFYPAPYKDPVGIPTIGYGTIAYPNGKKVSLSDPIISEAQAIEYLEFELKDKKEVVEKFLSEIGLE